MTDTRYDVAVIGLGAMGAAALAHLAQRGVRTIGIERFERLHELGASHGESRIIRKAYFEDPAYVPLLEHSYELWKELERESRRTLLDFTGVLFVGTPESESIAGTLRSAQRYNLPLETYNSAELAASFPGTMPRPDEIGLLERQAGIAFPEAGVDAHLDIATSRGAKTRFSTRVVRHEKRGGIHRLSLEDGSTIGAQRIVFCAGMWSAELLPELSLPLRIQRNVQIWFQPKTAAYDHGRFPAFLVERADLPAALYGFPAMHGKLKAALHRFGESVDPENLDRHIRDSDIGAVAGALDQWMEGAAGSYVRGRVCTYSLTPDGNFIIDRHPSDGSVTIACGFSGHGYKFCPVVGELVADLSLAGGTTREIGFLGIDRFNQSSMRVI